MRISRVAVVVLALACVVACGKKGSPAGPTSITEPSAQPTGGANGQQTIEGIIESISAPTIVVGGQRIVVDPTATIRSGAMPIAFDDLRVGARSRVTAQSDGGTLHGSAVDVLDSVGTPAHYSGVVSDLTRDGDSLQFRLGSRLLRGNVASQVDGAGALVGGATVDVDALQRTEYAYAQRVTVQPSPSPAPEPSPSPSPNPDPNNVNLKGVLGAVSGLCPVITFPVTGQIVVTNTSTVYANGNCSNVVAGGSAQVSGTQAGNVVVARQITLR